MYFFIFASCETLSSSTQVDIVNITNVEYNTDYTQ